MIQRRQAAVAASSGSRVQVRQPRAGTAGCSPSTRCYSCPSPCCPDRPDDSIGDGALRLHIRCGAPDGPRDKQLSRDIGAARVRLTGGSLHQERPLRANLEVDRSEIRRMFVGRGAVESYTSSSELETSLEFRCELRGGNELIERLARLLPESAGSPHPSGELAGRLSEQLSGRV